MHHAVFKPVPAEGHILKSPGLRHLAAIPARKTWTCTAFMIHKPMFVTKLGMLLQLSFSLGILVQLVQEQAF